MINAGPGPLGGLPRSGWGLTLLGARKRVGGTKTKPVPGHPPGHGFYCAGHSDIKSDEIMNGVDDAAMTARSGIVQP
ncbi:hypothetical protein GCM10009097_11530 [Pigmentiphaga daeguensis]|uniref:Uncharacterized protein n=1 Tax=Pigmentiphaga daeguensis TaxID=414049 RepID=A0ABP3LB48_9BURK